MDDLIRRVAHQVQTTLQWPALELPWLDSPLDSPVDRAADTFPATDEALHPKRLASLIDHTLLKPDATPAHIELLCHQAIGYRFASVCVNPCYVPLCSDMLQESVIQTCTVVGFPLGATTTAMKVAEAQQACQDGATEVDIVLSIGYLKVGDYRRVFDEIEQVATTCHTIHALCKVIIETALLTDAEKVAACVLAAQANADFVKTSTGFAGGGATVEDVTLMRRTVGPSIGVKASGGIRTLQHMRAMIAAGATRIGSSAGMQIMDEESQSPT